MPTVTVLQVTPGFVCRYISEQDRFYTDFAEEEKKRREHVLKTKEEQTEHRRMEKIKSEEARWKRIDAEFAAERARQRRLMRSGAPSNESSVPYNPLTLQYAPSHAGEELKYQDEQIRYRAGKCQSICNSARAISSLHHSVTF